MKKITFLKLFAFAMLLGITTSAQVGIGTTSPKGILDVESSVYGVVYPSAALTSTIVAAPVINPKGGALEVGTTIYNTNTTNTGANDVEPGIYSWDGSKWVTHFFIRQHELHEQTSTLRSSSLLGFQDVPGLGVLSGKSFTAIYSGLYRIEVRVSYGGGNIINNSDVNAGVAEGDFRFTFDGTDHVIHVTSVSAYHNDVGTGTAYSDTWGQTYKTIYVNLVAGQTYNFSLQFDQYDAPGFEASGNLVLSDDGRGYVGSDIPCFIEISYIDEN
ncbi:hypothetical protein [Constantimarinum furrinae]|uniref:Uncharacterized protein n=1 Tax=Constantimarinum furrinae TaxID=2562285 RepID=A0A7G8PUD2_9FLAO|nr:hypothetical protein [Constantimarinum furrinae]QNJ97948.1 hypothetical protein ALE3EI_1386 [Constantimarinum furrinae]